MAKFAATAEVEANLNVAVDNALMFNTNAIKLGQFSLPAGGIKGGRILHNRLIPKILPPSVPPAGREEKALT